MRDDRQCKHCGGVMIALTSRALTKSPLQQQRLECRECKLRETRLVPADAVWRRRKF